MAQRTPPGAPDGVPRDDTADEPEASPDERLYSTVPLETEHGEVVIRQQNVGADNMEGGGEWPDPETPPRPPAPGAE
jgi:hypothetical protein